MEKPEVRPLTFRMQQIWSNYCRLNLQDRSDIAEQLGPVGRVLNIAANVQNFVASGGQATDHPIRDVTPEDSDDDDIIDVEFEES